MKLGLKMSTKFEVKSVVVKVFQEGLRWSWKLDSGSRGENTSVITDMCGKKHVTGIRKYNQCLFVNNLRPLNPCAPSTPYTLEPVLGGVVPKMSKSDREKTFVIPWELSCLRKLLQGDDNERTAPTISLCVYEDARKFYSSLDSIYIVIDYNVP